MGGVDAADRPAPPQPTARGSRAPGSVRSSSRRTATRRSAARRGPVRAPRRRRGPRAPWRANRPRRSPGPSDEERESVSTAIAAHRPTTIRRRARALRDARRLRASGYHGRGPTRRLVRIAPVRPLLAEDLHVEFPPDRPPPPPLARCWLEPSWSSGSSWSSSLGSTSAASVSGSSAASIRRPAVTDRRSTIRDLYNTVFAIAVVIFFVVEGLIIWTVLRYRRKPGDDELPPQTHGNAVAEVVWTVVPTLIVAFMFVISWQTLNSVEADLRRAADADPRGRGPIPVAVRLPRRRDAACETQAALHAVHPDRRGRWSGHPGRPDRPAVPVAVPT